MKENMSLFQGSNDPRNRIQQMCNILSLMEPKDVSDAHDVLIKLQATVEDILSGKKF